MSRGLKTILRAEGRRCLIETVARGLAGRLRRLTRGRRGLLLLDRAFRAETEDWRDALPGFSLAFTARRGEAAKNWGEARRLLTRMAEAGLARDDWLVVRGGGSLSDLGAFCAGLYRRGLRLILVTTTLLGAVDAAVGGKTALNFGGAKNQVGHFYLPERVLVDLAAFRSLPRARLAEGLAEAYKTGLLFDRNLADLVDRRSAELLAGDQDLLAETARRSFQAKAALVARDFREEKGLREVLNLGHTYGHVAEAHAGLNHGRAVALGLSVAAELSRGRAGLPASEAARIQAVSGRLGGPWPPPVPEAAARRLLQADKKIRGGRLRFVALAEVERPVIMEVSADEILNAAAAALG
ncbi:MAG: 3-dehydroquinate synthase [Candidatus Adiutrix sp.]|jgi:3-dehydroquinate synthetase|nr:3-dehydroquinate synthase [Candidatus Adiutrix sp.]